MKVLSAETNLGSATNITNAAVVRLFNSGDDNILVTQKDFLGTNEGTFMVMSGDVVYCEKYYTDTLEGGAAIKATKVAYSSMMNFVESSVAGPTYTYSVSATNVDEGGSFTTTVTTTNVDDNTTLYWSLSGTGITSGDFSSGALTGSGTISNNTFNFSHTLANDGSVEGSELVTLKLFTDSGRNTQVGNEVTVEIADTSTVVIGQQAFTTAGSFSWTAPAGVTSVSVVVVGAGGGGANLELSGSNGGGGGGGGGLGYKNNYTVVPGNTYTVVVGTAGAANTGYNTNGGNGGDSYFVNTSTTKGGGGMGAVSAFNLKGSAATPGSGVSGAGGNYTGDGGGNGGSGCPGFGHPSFGAGAGGGGGAGGYSGNGGNGGTNNGGTGAGQDGSGGAGGGGGVEFSGGNKCAGGGGGTGIWGEGTSGTGGQATASEAAGGIGGSLHWMSWMREDPATGDWLRGQGRYPPYSQGASLNTGEIAGGTYGGAAGAEGGGSAAYNGASGAVRIIWGAGRAFPSTNTEDLNCAIYGHDVSQNPYGPSSTPINHHDPEVKTPSGSNPDNHPFGTYNGGVS